MVNQTIGILKERISPPDSRTPLTPQQAADLQEFFPKIRIIAEASDIRCFKDEAYVKAGIEVKDDLGECDLLLGIKEIPSEYLMPGKTYMFFSHTYKEQEHNRDMLRAILEKDIRLIDYELLTDENGQRIIGFGRFAGLVGTNYGMLMLGKRSKAFEVKPAIRCDDLKEMKKQYKNVEIPTAKIVLTGSGHVASGCIELLEEIGIRQVKKEEFLEGGFEEPVYVQLFSQDLYQNAGSYGFDRDDFHQHPELYKSTFGPFTKVANILINAIYWDPDAPQLFKKEDTKKENFKIKIIADITNDLEGSIPITLKQTNSVDPIYGYNPFEDAAETPYQPHTIDMMTVYNLPNELPKDASASFGEVLCKKILPRFHVNPEDSIFERATITRKGKLTENFKFLRGYIKGK